MKKHQMTAENKRTIVSGSGKVAIYAAEKAMQNGMKVIAMSDSKGYIVDENLCLDTVKKIKEEMGNPENIKVIATGGMSSLIALATDSIDILEPNLTIHGLKFLYDMNK